MAGCSKFELGFLYTMGTSRPLKVAEWQILSDTRLFEQFVTDVLLASPISHREGIGKKKRVPIGKESVGHSAKK